MAKFRSLQHLFRFLYNSSTINILKLILKSEKGSKDLNKEKKFNGNKFWMNQEISIHMKNK